MKDLQAKVNQFIAQAKAIQREEVYPALTSDVEKAFRYQYISEEDQLIYTYEEVDGNENVLVAELEAEPLNLPDGIGGRQYINAGSNKCLSAVVTLANNVTNLNGTAYTYSGFGGGKLEADIGFQWSTNNGGTGTAGWKPVVKVGKDYATNSGSNYLPGYDQVQQKNSYLPGQDITFYVYYNYNNTGKVRFKTMGYARYATLSGTGQNTYLTNIVEYAANVGTPTYFKLLATIAGPESTVRGSFTAIFKDIKLDDKIITTSNYGSTTIDSATVTPSNNGSTVTITVL